MTCLICEASIQEHIGWRSFIHKQQESVICEECQNKFQLIQGETCKGCGRPLAKLDAAYHKEGLCFDCERWGDENFLRNQSVFEYNEFMKEVVGLWKFRGDYELIKVFSPSIKEAFNQNEVILVPIPLSEKRLYERGFNQAMAIAEQLGHPIENLLERTESEQKQSKKSREQRLHSKSPFILNQTSCQLADKHIILIDDIYTTGTTLRHAAKTLKPLHPHSIQSFTLARS
ncbi:ComF family protein [Bacillus tianshenii]|nr:ComF family protein [Bacillus tianshenii]